MPNSPETEFTKVKQASFLEAFQEAANRKPSYPVLVYEGRYFSYRSIDQMSSSLSEFLVSRGCEPGSRVGILLPMSPQYLISLLGALKSGAIPVNFGSLKNSEYHSISTDQRNDWLIIKSDSDIIPERGEKVITARIGDLMNFIKGIQTDGHHNNQPPGFVSRLIDIILEKPREKDHGKIQGKEAIGFLSYGISGEPNVIDFNGGALCERALTALGRITGTGSVFRNASCIPPASPEGFILSVLMPVMSTGYSIFPSSPDPGIRIFKIADTYNANFITLFPEIISKLKEIEYPNRDRIRGIISTGLEFNSSLFSNIASRNNFRIFYFFGIPELMGMTHCMELSSDSLGRLLPLDKGETKVESESGVDSNPEGEKGPTVTGNNEESIMSGEFGIKASIDTDGSIGDIKVERDIAIIIGRHTSRCFIEKSAGTIPGVLEFVADFKEITPGIRKIVFYCVKDDRRADEKRVISYLNGKLSQHNLPSEIIWKHDIPRSISGQVLRNLLIENSDRVNT